MARQEGKMGEGRTHVDRHQKKIHGLYFGISVSSLSEGIQEDGQDAKGK